MHPSLLKRFPLLGFCLLVCSVPNFRPDTGGRRWTLIQGASSLAPREGRALLSPLRCSGSRLLYMERALCCARFQPSGVPQKCGTKNCARVPSFPGPSSSGSQELAGRTLPGCGPPSPSVVPASVPARPSRVPAPCVSRRPSRRMSPIQNLRRSLIRNWRPVCSG